MMRHGVGREWMGEPMREVGLGCDMVGENMVKSGQWMS